MLQGRSEGLDTYVLPWSLRAVRMESGEGDALDVFIDEANKVNDGRSSSMRMRRENDFKKRMSNSLCDIFSLHLSICSIKSPLLFKVQKERRKTIIV